MDIETVSLAVGSVVLVLVGFIPEYLPHYGSPLPLPNLCDHWGWRHKQGTVERTTVVSNTYYHWQDLSFYSCVSWLELHLNAINKLVTIKIQIAPHIWVGCPINYIVTPNLCFEVFYGSTFPSKQFSTIKVWLLLYGPSGERVPARQQCGLSIIFSLFFFLSFLLWAPQGEV